MAALVARFLELMDEAGGGGEGDREPPLTGGKTQGQGNMGLPGAAVAEHDDVVASNNKLAARQLQYQRLVEAGHRGEVEGVQALHRREAGLRMRRSTRRRSRSISSGSARRSRYRG